MRVVFMGTPSFALPSLEKLLAHGHQVVGVVTRPDRPRGRGKKIQPPPVKEFALAHGLAIYQPLHVKESGFLDALGRLQPEVIIIVAFGQIIPLQIISLPPYGCINLHASLLPKYRGAAPIHRAVINGETKTGVTTMFINEKLDEGDILLQETIPIKEEDNAGTIHDRLAKQGADLLVKTLALLAQGQLKPQPQDHGQATYAPLLRGEDEIIDWSKSAQAIFNLTRGMDPWPGAKTTWDKKTLKIYRVKINKPEINPEFYPLTALNPLPGQVLTAAPDKGLLVQTGEGRVWIMELQAEGGKRLAAQDFLRGNPLSVNQRLGIKG
ncbi:MAG TPA: methionyl-tRNA formyltransferase [Desulfotomaculum sp.]|nr:methionyl-tRNA formyltransferase [Desulfotomaculum sp.]